jgi:hypothetical protein
MKEPEHWGKLLYLKLIVLIVYTRSNPLWALTLLVLITNHYKPTTTGRQLSFFNVIKASALIFIRFLIPWAGAMELYLGYSSNKAGLVGFMNKGNRVLWCSSVITTIKNRRVQYRIKAVRHPTLSNGLTLCIERYQRWRAPM